MPSTHTASQAPLIERFGVLADRAGLSRIAGRILGLLLLSPGELSLDEMAERLSVSRASVSTDARRLLNAGIVERVGRPGDRKDYYQITPRHYLHDLEHHFASMQEFVRLLDEATQETTNRAVRARLTESLHAYTEIMSIISTTIGRWKETPAGPGTIQRDGGLDSSAAPQQ